MATNELLPTSNHTTSSRNAVTTRALLLGTALILPNAYWIMMVEGIWHTGHPTVMSLAWNVIFNILVLLGINVLLKRLAPARALSQAEFVTVYVMLAISSALCGHDTLQLGVPNLSHPWYFGTEANKWESLFWKYLPEFLTVSDTQVIEDFYDGKTTLYTAERLRAWAGPVLWWCAFILALGLVMTGLNILVRKQWTEREKLGFPIVQLPLAMTRDGGSAVFFANRMLWIGVLAAAALDIWNGLHYFWPAIPLIDVRHDRDHYLDTGPWGAPWNAMGRIWLPLYPFIIALGFLLPLDLCFSMWFFFIFRKLQQVAARAAPIPYFPLLPYLDQQSTGAWIALFAYSIWTGRRYFKDLIISALQGRASGEIDPHDPLSQRGAFAAIGIGLGFIVYFCLKAGMSLGCIIPFLGFTLMLFLALTRMRAELGPPSHEMAGQMNAGQVLTSIVGTRALGSRNLTMFPLFWWMTGRGYRTTPMPHQLEGFYLAAMTKMDPRRLALAMAIAFGLGSLAAYWAAIHLTYIHGTSPLISHNHGQWTQLASRLSNDLPPDYQAITFMGVGTLVTVGLTWMRTRFLWWPFHPAGYALGMLFGVEYFWTCLVIAFAIKLLVLRYGGHQLNQKVLPLMYGVIIGEYCVGAFWSVMSVILQRPMYDFCPG
ncbi:MAG: DUF6785 family protein [Candidatus Zipacnadales bacterium]